MNTHRAEGAALARTLSGLPVAAAVLLLIWVPALSWVFALAITALVAQGYREWCALAQAKGLRAESAPGVLAAVLVAFSGYWGSVQLTTGVLTAGVLVLLVLQTRRGLTIGGVSASVLGVVYAGWFGAYVVLAHHIPHTGTGIATLLIAVIALSDTGAYTIGSAMGKHKMAPAISPKKSWEGAAGGLVFAAIAGAAMWLVHEEFRAVFPDWSFGRYVAVAVVLSIVGQLGDLAESAMKRDAGVKDSGNFLPGHGGVLDRCDSYLFAAPVLYYLAAL